MINLILADLLATAGDWEAAQINLEIGKQLTAHIRAPQVANLVQVAEAKLEQSARKTQALVEPLSERELDVLRLIAQGYSNKEICDQLYLALNTVKGYNRTIFGKLGVKNRTEAANKARELNLL